MNKYKVTYITAAKQTLYAFVIDRNEAAARKALKAQVKGAEITDIELVDTGVNATKAQEREALEKIKAMVEELGPQSYLKTAFDGAFQDAEDNIMDDAAYSMKARWESSEEKLREMSGNYVAAKRTATVLQEQIEALQEQLAAAQEQIKALERRLIPEELRRDLWMLVTAEAEESRARMAKSADMIVTCSDNPGCVGFVESVADYRKEKNRAEAMEKRAAGLDALEPKDK